MTEKQLEDLKTRAIPLGAPRKLPDRITVVQNITHEHFGDHPLGIDNAFSMQLLGEEEPYSRRLKVAKRQNLDVGWVEKPAYLIIQNLEGMGRTAQVSPEEAEQTKRRLLHIYSGPACTNPIIVRPCELKFLSFSDLRLVEVAPASDQVSVKIVILGV